MKRYKFIKETERQVKTKLTIRRDRLEYNCPECGQKLEVGLNDQVQTKISYPNGAPLPDLTDHSHIYPTYVDVEQFASQGAEIPAIAFTEKLKQLKNTFLRNFRGR